MIDRKSSIPLFEVTARPTNEELESIERVYRLGFAGGYASALGTAVKYSAEIVDREETYQRVLQEAWKLADSLIVLPVEQPDGRWIVMMAAPEAPPL